MFWQYANPPSSATPLSALPQNLQSIEMIVETAGIQEPVLPEAAGHQIPSRQCYTLGPFNEESQAQAIMESIMPKVKEALLRSKPEVRHHRYWVHIAPQENRQAAIAVSKALARKKIKDYYIVRGGERNNSISLGHFKEKKHADRRLKKLQEKGFDVSIEPIYREFKLYWLDYTILPDAGIDESFWSDLLPNGVGRLKRECN